MFYDKFKCSVIVNDNLLFLVKSDKRPGCIISPILFLITIDWANAKD